MQVRLTQAIVDALKTLKDVPDGLRSRFDAMTRSDGGHVLKLTDDDAMGLSELLQWHIRTDPATAKPTRETAPFAELIRLIDEAQI
ncbi:MAG: hypothetical protein ACHQU1_00470 [Gemmatimonadales bacterium]